MKAHVLRGSKQEIAASLAQISGEVRAAIVFVEESAPATRELQPTDAEDIFAEMGPFMVDAPEVDDSREAIYSRREGD
jgi:hypothetical protein